MRKIFSFLAGSLCGMLVGGVTVILIAPTSGEQLRANVEQRIQETFEAARTAREETQRDLEAQFERAKLG